jgi:TRAP-type C4-dicarboxylate transport system permease small subunit
MVDRTSLQTIIYDAILIALSRRGFLYLALPITPCALTFPSLETSCKPLRRRELNLPTLTERREPVVHAFLQEHLLLYFKQII